MAYDAIVFANPVPEILLGKRKKGGVRIVATGRLDCENRTNNLLGFPAVFRGALDVHTTRITDEVRDT